MPSHNAVHSSSARNLPRFSSDGQEKTGVEEKSRSARKNGSKTRSLFFEGGVLVRTKLSESNHVVWGGEFLEFVLKTVVVMFAILSMVWVVDPAAGQNIFGRIAGTVTDSQGGVVTGVKITIVNEETKLDRQTTTDSNGYSVANDVPVGGSK